MAAGNVGVGREELGGERRSHVVRVGLPAPYFDGQAYVNGEIRDLSLDDYRGKTVVLVFYPLGFTFVCPTELHAFARDLDRFRELRAEVVAVSVDSIHSHKAWFARAAGRALPGAVGHHEVDHPRLRGARADPGGGAPRHVHYRPQGIVRYQVVSALNLGRSTDETFRTLQALHMSGLCPVDWRPGQPTLGKG